MNIENELKQIRDLYTKSRSLREEAWAKEDPIRTLAIHALEVLYPEQSLKFTGGNVLVTEHGVKFTKKVRHGVGFGVYEEEDELSFHVISYILSYKDLQLYIDETS